MDLVHDVIAKEDRISNLPDDIIHRILSFIDMKYAIQTSTLSKKWKHIWTTMPYLNLNSKTFHTLARFIKFVSDALSHRNHHTEVFAVELSLRGAITRFVAHDIVKYAYSHNVRQLTIIWSKFTDKFHEFPRSLFSSHTLKHLTIETREKYFHGGCVPISAWDFPALETLNLSNLAFSAFRHKCIDLFSKCVNLKDLTLHHCTMFYVEIFNVCAPQLSNLTITDPGTLPKVFNVVAPQLQNLTVLVNAVKDFDGSNFLHLSTEGLDSLEKVNLSLSMSNYNKHIHVPQLLDLFHKLRSAKFLILNYDIIKTLSLRMDQLLREPCPFISLRCLKIDTHTLKQKDRIAEMHDEVINYFLESSPSAIFIMDIPKTLSLGLNQLLREPCPFISLKCLKIDMLKQKERITEMPAEVRNFLLESSSRATFIVDIPQVSHKRSRQEDDKDTMAKKVAKLEEEKQSMVEEKITLEAKIKMQDGVIAEQERLMSQMINCKMAELQVQVAGGDPGYELLRLIKSIMDLTHESSRVAIKAQVSCLYQEMKSLFFTSVDASQWEKIEMELGITERNFSNNDVPSAALPLASSPSPFSADVVTSSSIANAWSRIGSKAVVQPSQSSRY